MVGTISPSRTPDPTSPVRNYHLPPFTMPILLKPRIPTPTSRHGRPMSLTPLGGQPGGPRSDHTVGQVTDYRQIPAPAPAPAPAPPAASSAREIVTEEEEEADRPARPTVKRQRREMSVALYSKIPESLHRNLKYRSIAEGKTISQLVTELLSETVGSWVAPHQRRAG